MISRDEHKALLADVDARVKAQKNVDLLLLEIKDLRDYIRISGEEHDEEECPVCHFKPGEIDTERRERDWE